MLLTLVGLKYMKYTVTHIVICLGAELHERRVHILVDGVAHYAGDKKSIVAVTGMTRPKSNGREFG